MNHGDYFHRWFISTHSSLSQQSPLVESTLNKKSFITVCQALKLWAKFPKSAVAVRGSLNDRAGINLNPVSLDDHTGTTHRGVGVVFVASVMESHHTSWAAVPQTV